MFHCQTFQWPYIYYYYWSCDLILPHQIDCQNYYKVLVMISDNELMSCGTSAFQPMCDIRTVSLEGQGEQGVVEFKRKEWS